MLQVPVLAVVVSSFQRFSEYHFLYIYIIKNTFSRRRARSENETNPLEYAIVEISFRVSQICKEAAAALPQIAERVSRNVEVVHFQ